MTTVLPQSGQTVVLPDGDTTITSPIVLSEVQGGTIRGGVGSRILYAGPPTPGVVQLARCGKCQLEGFDVVVTTAGVTAAVLVTNLPGTSPRGWVSTANRFTRVNVLYDMNGHSPKYGYNFDSTALGGDDGNNDCHWLDECYAGVFDKDGAGFRQNGSQVHQIVYNRCRAYNGNGWGGVGLLCDSGAYFVWQNGGMTGCDCDFVTTTKEMQGTIRGHNSEGGAALLRTGREGTRFLLNVSDVRWEGNPVAGTPVVDCDGPGPYKFDNCFCTGIKGVVPTWKFDAWSGPGAPNGSVDVSGLMIRVHGGPTVPRVIAAVPLRWELKSHGFSYEYVKPDGARVYKSGPLLWNRPVGP